MTRLIDADALIESMTKFSNATGEDMTHGIFYAHIAPTIDAEPHWIPCSERLPAEKGEYLVTYHPCYFDDVEDEIRVGIDTFRGRTTWAKKKYQRVIAWMPLPKPYEVEE